MSRSNFIHLPKILQLSFFKSSDITAVFIDLWLTNKGKSFFYHVSLNICSKPIIILKVNGNLSELMAFSSTPSPKQNLLLHLAVLLNIYLDNLSCQGRYLTSLLATVQEQAESNGANLTVSLASLDIFIFESFIMFWQRVSTGNKIKLYMVRVMTVMILFLKPVQSRAKCLPKLHLKQCIILLFLLFSNQYSHLLNV